MLTKMHPLVNLAKQTVEIFIKERKIISPPNELSDKFFEKRAGVFVTIEKNGELRGCIGTYLPTRENIAKEVIQNAIAAATKDWRFGPVQKEEFPYLSYTVYILSEPELVKDISNLDPKKYGIIVKTVPILANFHEFEHEYSRMDVVFNGRFVPKTGVLLPDLEGVDTVEKQIFIACQKAGIDPEREKFLIYRFTVEKFK
jgi:AmmeMemoRadiSam system protein A